MRRAASLILAAGLVPATAAGQSVVVEGGGVARGYSFSDSDRLGLASFRVSALPVRLAGSLEQVSIGVSGGYARAVLGDGRGAEVEVAEPMDLQWRVAVAPVRFVSLAVAGSVPASDGAWTPEEAAAAGLVSGELLPPFSAVSFSNGGSVGGDVRLSLPLGAALLDLSAGFRSQMRDVELEGVEFTYRPGDQLRLGAALDVRVGRASTWAARATYQAFGEDVGIRRFVEGSSPTYMLFRSGPRIEAVTRYAFPLGLAGSAVVFGGIRRREGGESLLEQPSPRDPPAGDLARLAVLLPGLDDAPAHRTVFGGAGVRIAVGAHALLPEVEARLVTSSDGRCLRPGPEGGCADERGWFLGAGLAAELLPTGRTAGPFWMIMPVARVRTGRVRSVEGGSSAVVGWEAGVTLRLGWSR